MVELYYELYADLHVVRAVCKATQFEDARALQRSRAARARSRARVGKEKLRNGRHERRRGSRGVPRVCQSPVTALSAADARDSAACFIL